MLGPGDDGWPLPAGALRFGVSSRFLSADERFNLTGNREGLGAPYAGLLGANTFPTLVNFQNDIRAASGVNAFTATLGVARSQLRPSAAFIPLELALGLGRGLTIRASGTFFTGAQESQWLLDASNATVGVNPAAANAGIALANETLLSALDTAAAGLERLADGCAIDPLSDPRCAAVIADINTVRALIDRERNTSDELAHTYGGRTNVPSSYFVPIAGSSADSGVAARIATMKNDFSTYGVASVADGDRPGGASAPPTITELYGLLADSTYGYDVNAMRRQYRQGIGDVDVGVMLVVLNGLGSSGPWSRDSVRHGGLRQSFGFTYRFGTGRPPEPDNPLALATGDGQDDLEFISATDIAASAHAWASIVARYTLQQPRDGIERIPDGSGSTFIPMSRRRMSRTELGDRLEVSLTPRWVMNDWFSAGIGWRWTRQEGEHIEELAPAVGVAPLTYAGPVRTTHEATIGVTWSTVAPWRRGHAPWPLEIQWDKSVVVAGSGNVARFSADRISVRAYVKLWGR